jgi:hypothetical protein
LLGPSRVSAIFKAPPVGLCPSRDSAKYRNRNQENQHAGPCSCRCCRFRTRRFRSCRHVQENEDSVYFPWLNLLIFLCVGVRPARRGPPTFAASVIWGTSRAGTTTTRTRRRFSVCCVICRARRASLLRREKPVSRLLTPARAKSARAGDPERRSEPLRVRTPGFTGANLLVRLWRLDFRAGSGHISLDESFSAETE